MISLNVVSTVIPLVEPMKMDTQKKTPGIPMVPLIHLSSTILIFLVLLVVSESALK